MLRAYKNRYATASSARKSRNLEKIECSSSEAEDRQYDSDASSDDEGVSPHHEGALFSQASSKKSKRQEGGKCVLTKAVETHRAYFGSYLEGLPAPPNADETQGLLDDLQLPQLPTEQEYPEFHEAVAKMYDHSRSDAAAFTLETEG